MQDRKASIPDRAIVLELSLLSSIMELAIESGWDGAPEANPVKLVSKRRVLKVEKGVPRPLKPEEVIAILDASPPNWRQFLEVMLDTGMRREELLGLEWAEVDLKARKITLPPHRVKTGKGRTVPLTDTAARTLLAIVPHTGSPHVFVNPLTGKRWHPAGGIANAFLRIKVRAGVPHAKIHQFRHTFASWTRQLGMARDDRKDIVGHTTEEAHDTYSENDFAVLRASLNQFSPSTLLAQHMRLKVDEEALDPGRS
jgi:integrase